MVWLLMAAAVMAGLLWIFLHLVTSVGMPFGPKGAYRHIHLQIQAEVWSIEPALNRYKSITGHYPRTDQGLSALFTQTDPIVGRSILGGSLPKDPWGRAYIYLCPGKVHADTYDLYSPGPDGIPGTADDDWGK